MLKQLIEKLIDRKNLTRSETSAAIQEMLKAPNAHQVAAFLVLLGAKGETVDELLGVIDALRSSMIAVEVKERVLDIVGTGGDASHSVNISTGSCIVAAACGVKIAKHGNRSVSSKCGAADLLEALGVTIEIPPQSLVKMIDAIGIGFMYAPYYHPGLKAISEIRRGLNVRTVFNLVGPLVNPAEASFRMIGVYNPKVLDLLAETLFRLGTEHTLVFHGSGMDELSCVGPAQVREVTASGVKSWILDPEALGLPRCAIEDLRGGDAAFNASLMLRALKGEEGPLLNTLALNAGVALWLYGKAESIQTGVATAKMQLKRGDPYMKLNQWIELCQTFSKK